MKEKPGVTDQSAIDELIGWMAEGAPGLADGRAIVSHVCERLNEAGVPVDLYRLFIFTIHPLIKGRRLQWVKGEGTGIVEADFALFDTAEYHHNPLPHVMKTRTPLRRRLVDPDCPHDYKVVEELIADGFTDYLVQPVIYIDGDVHTMSWSSRHPDGFSQGAIMALERLRPALTRLVESYVLRLNAANIISTYVGRGAGEQVLSGHIKRGDAEEITAIILFADLKDYTRLSNSLPASEMIALLNAYFDCVGEPVAQSGGEILKFMGDGLLAIFPVRTGEAAGLKKKAAKAREAVQKSLEIAAGMDPAPQYRTALHIGRFFYGNIGAASRLDFTAIGPPVNMAARLLGAATTLECDHVCSREFAQLLDNKLPEIGRLPLKGFDGDTAVHSILV